MLKNAQINKAATHKIATALGNLNDEVVYVGGAVVCLYIDDPTAEDVRPTKDIDIFLEISSLGKLEDLRETLTQKGFRQSAEDDVICRFRYQDIKVDVMATKPVGWAPGSPWFAAGIHAKEDIEVEGITINILPLPYFLATKFAAFYDRGGTDPRTSHDFEDIVYLLNHTSNVKTMIMNAKNDVQQFLKEAFLKILADDTLQEAIIGNLFYENQMVRFEKIMSELREIVNSID